MLGGVIRVWLHDRLELNFAAICEAIAGRDPDRECLVFRDRRFTWAAMSGPDPAARPCRSTAPGWASTGRSAAVDGWESPHDHVALYLYNGNEYLEGMLGVVQGPVRAVERQLPLRGRGAALRAGRRRAPRS